VRGADELLAANPVFGRAPREARARLVERSRVLELEARGRVLSEGDPAVEIFALESGAVRVFIQAANGDEVSCKLFRAPTIFGEAEAFYGVAFQENVEAVEPSRIVAMPIAAVRECLLASPEAGVAFVDDLAKRLAISIYNQRSLAFNPVTIRLANFLLDYAEWTSTPGERRWEIALSQDDMAAAIGATRRSIGKDVTAWQAEGLLERRGASYVVRDPEALERYADPERLRLAYRLGARASGG
jgi:CRP/FNR family transcriptional regulator, cyclic AMP receptor protein